MAKTGLSPSAINNSNQVLGSISESLGAVYDWITKTTTLLNPLPGQSSLSFWFGAINNLGDVVGNSGAHGLLYSAGAMTDVGACFLANINDKKIAVGAGAKNNPIYVDLALPTPALTNIPLPSLGTPSDGIDIWATAINATNNVVGIGSTAEPPYFRYPFVYQVGDKVAANLNDLIPPKSGYYLSDAFDINDSGQIVGTAWDGHDIWRPYLATPRSPAKVPNAWIPPWMISVWGGVPVDGGGPTSGGPVPPWGPDAWAALSLAQRETLISLGISNLAELLTNREARLQIQKLASDTAAGALEPQKRLYEPQLDPAQRALLMKAGERLRPSLRRR